MFVILRVYGGSCGRHNLAPTPQLADSYKQIDDRTSEFKLRQRVKFQNGEPLDGEAVKVTYEGSVEFTLALPQRLV